MDPQSEKSHRIKNEYTQRCRTDDASRATGAPRYSYIHSHATLCQPHSARTIRAGTFRAVEPIGSGLAEMEPPGPIALVDAKCLRSPQSIVANPGELPLVS